VNRPQKGIIVNLRSLFVLVKNNKCHTPYPTFIQIIMEFPYIYKHLKAILFSITESFSPSTISHLLNQLLAIVLKLTNSFTITNKMIRSIISLEHLFAINNHPNMLNKNTSIITIRYRKLMAILQYFCNFSGFVPRFPNSQTNIISFPQTTLTAATP